MGILTSGDRGGVGEWGGIVAYLNLELILWR